jgi:hypothetical protein
MNTNTEGFAEELVMGNGSNIKKSEFLNPHFFN